VRRRAYLALLHVFKRLPGPWRRRIVGFVSPSFTVGAICLIERHDGQVLLIKHSYRERWGVPGGLLRRGEDPADSAVREVAEEVGLQVELIGAPAVVVASEYRRVDVIYRARPSANENSTAARPVSAEISEVAWFDPDELPELQEETADALVALARVRHPAGPALR
jgi:ADP-ribose pyrophosphatase YjhB (NUDIX family)